MSSFVPFFSFDATSNLIVDNDDFAVDATRCASSPDYPAFVASTRTPWLVSTHPDVFECEPILESQVLWFCMLGAYMLSAQGCGRETWPACASMSLYATHAHVVSGRL